MPRYVIIGAGAIGVSLAAELKRAGNGVILIARGAQLAAARGEGITYVRPDGARTLDVPAYEHPGEFELRADDILILATKTQDAESALSVWSGAPVTLADGSRSTAGASLTLLTTQNGLEAERAALRYFATVIGGVLVTPAHFVEPGIVVAAGARAVGGAWIGRYPDAADPAVEELARTLRRANYEAVAVSDISAWKRAKLVASSTFVLDALYAKGDLRQRATGLLAAESRAILAGTGALADLAGAMGTDPAWQVAEVPGYAYGGTSTWQSLARSSSLETDFINGEVVLQARLQGIDAPLNAAVTAKIRAAAEQGLAPRSFGEADLIATFPGLRDGTDHQTVTAASGARAEVLVDANTLAGELTAGAGPALLDVRWKLGDPDGRRHYATAHLPGAVYVDLDTELAAHGAPEDGRHPLPSIEALTASARTWGLTDGQSVVVYDDNGGTSAARAWWLLRWAGVADVRILNGGIGAWSGEGHPLEHGASGDIPAGDIAAGDITLSEGHLPVLGIDEAADFPTTGVLLDARAGERYRGESEPVDPRAGHIPGAVSAPTAENLDGDGRFLSDAALGARFAALGIDGAERADGTDGAAPVAVYCGSGVTAAHEIAALAAIGIDAALYPGSWSAWSNRPERPVVTGAEPGGPGTVGETGEPGESGNVGSDGSESTTHRSASYAS